MNNEFNIKDSIYLISEDYELDLHNDYNFEGIHYSVVERRATLLWKRSDGDWVSHTAPISVEIEFRGVSRFQFLPRDPKIPFSEDDCLSTAGYWTDDDWCDGVFSSEKAPDPEWLRAFEFMSGATILIKADEAQATINR